MKLRTSSGPQWWLAVPPYANIFNRKLLLLYSDNLLRLCLTFIAIICFESNNFVYAGSIKNIVINEILPDPNSNNFNYDTDGDGIAEVEDEFVEFYNHSTSHIDISNWKIWDNQQAYTIPEGSVIPADGYLIVVGDWLDSPHIPKSCVITYGRHGGNGFGNTGDVIALVDPTNGEYIVGYYNADTPADLPLAFDGSILVRATDFGTDTDGLSLTRSPDGNTVQPIQTTALPTPVMTDNCGNVNGDGTPVTIDDLNQNNALSPVSQVTRTYIAGGAISRKSIDENQLKVTLIVTGGEDVTLKITGGSDAGYFTIDSRNRLFFIFAPDYEHPVDNDQDNVYQVEITAYGRLGTDTQSIYISVKDKPETNIIEPGCSGKTDDEKNCQPFVTISLHDGRLDDGSYWMEQDTAAMLKFIESALCLEPELIARIEFLYLALLGRTFDAHGLAWWANQALLLRESGEPTEQVLKRITQSFLTSNEFQQIAYEHQLKNDHGQWSNINMLNYLYAEMGREQDAGGFTFWSDYLIEHDLLQTLTAYSQAIMMNCDKETGDATFIMARIRLEISLLHKAHELKIIPREPWLKEIKSALLHNREKILQNQYEPDLLLQTLVSSEKATHYQHGDPTY